MVSEREEIVYRAADEDRTIVLLFLDMGDTIITVLTQVVARYVISDVPKLFIVETSRTPVGYVLDGGDPIDGS